MNTTKNTQARRFDNGDKVLFRGANCTVVSNTFKGVELRVAGMSGTFLASGTMVAEIVRPETGCGGGSNGCGSCCDCC